VQELTIPGDIIVCAIVRGGRAVVPTLGTAFEEGDVAHLVVAHEAYARVESLLGLR
jgi:Trk K+ transport system NAD-binding subunit